MTGTIAPTSLQARAPGARADRRAPEMAGLPPVAAEAGVRRPVAPTSCVRDSAAEEREFMAAMQDYKRSSGRMFPTWSEVLEVLKGLGYEKATA